MDRLGEYHFLMAHFAQLDDTNVVVQVLVINNSDITDDSGQEIEAMGVYFLVNILGLAGNWKQTSYRGKFRKNYAGVGFTYDAGRDAFIPPQPTPDAMLDETTCQWIVNAN